MKLITLLTFLFTFPTFLLSDEATNKLERSLGSSKTTNLVEEANRLSALGGVKHQKGDFISAVKLYDQSLVILKKSGLDDKINYANVMFLSAIASHKLGKSCDALHRMENVIPIYKVLAPTETLNMAVEESESVFKPSCGK